MLTRVYDRAECPFIVVIDASTYNSRETPDESSLFALQTRYSLCNVSHSATANKYSQTINPSLALSFPSLLPDKLCRVRENDWGETTLAKLFPGFSLSLSLFISRENTETKLYRWNQSVDILYSPYRELYENMSARGYQEKRAASTTHHCVISPQRGGRVITKLYIAKFNVK